MDKKVIICSSRKIKTYLRKREFCPGGGYIAWQDLKQDVLDLLDKKGFQSVPLFGTISEERDKFIREYVDFMGFIGRSNNALRWWATDIASKNRFTSRLPRLIQFFLTAVGAIEAGPYEELFIVDFPWTMVDSLNKFFKAKHIQVKCVNNRLRKAAGIIRGYLRRLSVAFYNIIRVYSWALFVRRQLKAKIDAELKSESPRYIVKTFTYSHSFPEPGRYQDVFFGSLPDFINNEKKVLIYACVPANYHYCIKKIKECSKNIIVPVEACLSLKDILSAAREFLTVTPGIRQAKKLFGYDLRDMINNELIYSSGGIQFYHFIHYWSTKNLLRKVPAETFLLTYENNPWERMCVLAVRESSPKTKIIGYQHTVVPQASVNMFISPHEKNLGIFPDKVLTVGSAPKRIMEKYGSYGSRIKTACGLRFEHLFSSSAAKRARTGNILLALEGIFDVYKLVNYVIKELKDSKEYSVTIRTHPVLPFKAFKHKLIHPFEKLSNFEVSRGRSLKEDIGKADAVIYWGTTVALEALSAGKPVIHFDNGSVLSYDPLFECKDLKETVTKDSPLTKTLDMIESLSDDEFYSRRDKAKAYLAEYFFPVNEDNMKVFLN